jgi:hypothetical protein
MLPQIEAVLLSTYSISPFELPRLFLRKTVLPLFENAALIARRNEYVIANLAVLVGNLGGGKGDGTNALPKHKQFDIEEFFSPYARLPKRIERAERRAEAIYNPTAARLILEAYTRNELESWVFNAVSLEALEASAESD